MIDHDKEYRFSKALRPFSLIIAFASTGIVWARVCGQQDFSVSLALLVVLGAVFAQAAVNLINDWSDRHQFDKKSPPYQAICQNTRLACLCFGIAAIAGLIIAWIRGPAVIGFAAIGFAACIAYTFEPFHLKKRGLGLISVFLVMGPVLMTGSGFAMTGSWNVEVLLDALIFSPLISLVLLANELRDYLWDRQTEDKTLTVRIGFRKASNLFFSLLIMTAFTYSIAIFSGLVRPTWLFLLPLALALWLGRFLPAARQTDLTRLPPLTGRLVLATGTVHILALLEI